MFDAIASVFVSTAWAMGSAPADQQQGPAGFFMSLMPLIIIFVIFYFLLIRPQQKRQKETEKMLSEIKKGDKVVTAGGIYGLIEQVNDKTVVLKVGEGTKIKVGKSYIVLVRSTSDED